MTIYDHAQALLAEANRTRTLVHSEFNGTPVTAAPGMPVEDVIADWSRRRERIQDSIFAALVGDARRALVGGRVVNVVGNFDGGDGMTVSILLDNGKQFVAQTNLAFLRIAVRDA